MSLSWNEIKTRAAAFVNEWKEKAPDAREEADAQTFQAGLFHIFGVERSQVAIFEQKVRLNDDANGYIDLFWKGHIIIEMKTPGKDMRKAYDQAKSYANALKPADLPKSILICDFNKFHYYNLEENTKLYEFALPDLVQYVELFSDLAGYKDVEYKKQDQVNIAAAERMGKLHDRLKEIGYEGHQLEVYLVRLLFCLFADDTGIFEPDLFVKYIIQRTNTDGSDLAMHLEKIFEILNKPVDKRLTTIDEQLDRFPYVNGSLFEEQLETADFDSKMRESLIECCSLDWGRISPAIFGSMFQSVMKAEERRNLGAHYTSEENILKLIHPLFLDSLWAEFDKYKSLKSDVRFARLNEFHDKLARLKFLDPACGCGNFLVITYREIRILELAVIKELLGGERILDVDTYIKVNVNQFYGIEIEEFPSKIAQVAMWLMDHQMNMMVRDMFGEYYIRIPLSASASIICANSLQTDWESIVPKKELNYILGNPPFVGAMIMGKRQRLDLMNVFGVTFSGAGEIDFVGAWYRKAADYIKGTEIECAFVSTNSICQGQQVSLIWESLQRNHNIKINFAHQTFKWTNEAKGKAAVFCIIVGFSLAERKEKKIYHYATVASDPVESLVKQINAYLIDAPNVFIRNRSNPLCPVPEMNFGNMPRDGGGFMHSEEERIKVIRKEPLSEKWIKPYIGAEEFLHRKNRWCIWLVNVSPTEIKLCPTIMDRIEKVKNFRASSKAAGTRKFAEMPTVFCQITQPEGLDYIIIPDASLYHFGILTSTMHMAWTRYVCGRLEMRYRYSKDIVYNNFPWPEPTGKQKDGIEQTAQGVLDARDDYPDSSLADIYDPNTMPADLVKAHNKLDKLVEKAYGKSFDNDADRVAFLFEKISKTHRGYVL